MPQTRVRLAALILAAALPLHAGEASPPKGAAALAERERACKADFRLNRDFKPLADKLAEIDSSKPKVARQLRDLVTEHSTCKALHTQNLIHCKILGAIQGEAAEKHCNRIYRSFSIWVAAEHDLKADAKDHFACKYLANKPDNADKFCLGISKLWKVRDHNMCELMKPVSRFDDCLGAMQYWTAPKYKPRPFATVWDHLEMSLQADMWQRKRPACDNYPWLGKGTPDEVATRKGACVAALRPQVCDALLEPVKDFFCFPFGPPYWNGNPVVKH